MPAPMTAPMPSMTRSVALSVRLRAAPPSAAAASAVRWISATLLIRKTDITAGPPCRRRILAPTMKGRFPIEEAPDVLVVMRKDATAEQIRGVQEAIEARGYKAHPIPGAQRTAIGVTGNKGAEEAAVLEGLPGVLEVIPVTHAYKLVSREVKSEDTIVRVGARGGRRPGARADGRALRGGDRSSRP